MRHELVGQRPSEKCSCGWTPPLGASVTRSFDQHLIETGVGIGVHGNRPWPPTQRRAVHDPECLRYRMGPGGGVCDLGCESYIEQVEAYWEGRDDTANEVVTLWNLLRGWIPGASYQELAETIGVDPERLWHYDQERGEHVVEGVTVSMWTPPRGTRPEALP